MIDKKMRLSELQIDKTSSYLLDISKLMFGVAVVPLFIPGSVFDVPYFLAGVSASVISFGTGLLILKSKIHD